MEATRAAAECADVVIAEINSRMPRCYGDTLVHMSHLDKVVYVDRDLPHYELPGKYICNDQLMINSHSFILMMMMIFRNG